MEKLKDMDWISQQMVILPFFYLLLGAVFSTPSLATRLFIEHDLKANPAFMQFVTMAVTVPWIIKPLYGIMIDTFPLYGYRRKSYTMVFSLVSTVGWVLLAVLPASSVTTFFCMLLSSFGLVVCDVVVDSCLCILAKYEEGKDIGNIQSNTTAMRSIGYLIGSTLSFFFLSSSQDPKDGRVAPRSFFMLTAVVTSLIFVFSFFLHDVKVSQGDNKLIRDKIRAIKDCFDNEKIWKPALFIFCIGAPPSSSGAFFYFLNEPVEAGGLGMSARFLSVLSIFGALSAITGAWVFRTFLKKTCLKKIIFYGTLLAFFFSFSQIVLIYRLNVRWGVSDKFFLLGDDIILSALSRILFLPILVLSARLCPEGVEASIYASIISVSNMSEILSSCSGSLLTSILGVGRDVDTGKIDFTNLPLLSIICNVSTILPLFFLRLMPSEYSAASSAPDKPAHEYESLSKQNPEEATTI